MISLLNGNRLMVEIVKFVRKVTLIPVSSFPVLHTSIKVPFSEHKDHLLALFAGLPSSQLESTVNNLPQRA